jgi:hypothetical protein
MMRGVDGALKKSAATERTNNISAANKGMEPQKETNTNNCHRDGNW